MGFTIVVLTTMAANLPAHEASHVAIGDTEMSTMYGATQSDGVGFGPVSTPTACGALPSEVGCKVAATTEETVRQPSLNTGLAFNIPARPQGAPTGSEFIRTIESVNIYKREAAILKELLSGNIPDFLRTAATVHTRFAGHEASITVMPDYLAIGSNTDFVRVPVNPQSAQKLAEAFGGVVPTKKIVDETYRQADVKLSPVAMHHSIGESRTFIGHHHRIERQRQGKRLGALTAGHKKDVINSRRAHRFPDRVCIYGWHKLPGAPIQPLSTVHDLHHVDYSHGLRLMQATITVDGRPTQVQEVLSNTELAGLLSHEGTLPTSLPTPS